MKIVTMMEVINRTTKIVKNAMRIAVSAKINQLLALTAIPLKNSFMKENVLPDVIMLLEKHTIAVQKPVKIVLMRTVWRTNVISILILQNARNAFLQC
jgi:hypothetical protein